MLIPIEDLNGGTDWLNGSGQVRVVGFAWFVITGQPGYTVRFDGTPVVDCVACDRTSRRGQ